VPPLDLSGSAPPIQAKGSEIGWTASAEGAAFDGNPESSRETVENSAASSENCGNQEENGWDFGANVRGGLSETQNWREKDPEESM
jgi:hypothetical protein